MKKINIDYLNGNDTGRVDRIPSKDRHDRFPSYRSYLSAKDRWNLFQKWTRKIDRMSLPDSMSKYLHALVRVWLFGRCESIGMVRYAVMKEYGKDKSAFYLARKKTLNFFLSLKNKGEVNVLPYAE